jgi:hypothetical protein
LPWMMGAVPDKHSVPLLSRNRKLKLQLPCDSRGNFALMCYLWLQQNKDLMCLYIYKKKFIILREKMIGSRRPRAVDCWAMRLRGNEMEEKFSSYLYDEWA